MVTGFALLTMDSTCSSLGSSTARLLSFQELSSALLIRCSWKTLFIEDRAKSQLLCLGGEQKGHTRLVSIFRTVSLAGRGWELPTVMAMN